MRCTKLVSTMAVMSLAIAMQLPASADTLSTASEAGMTSAGALAFDDADVLFIGDSKAGRVHAFALPESAFDDQSAVSLGRASTFEGRTLIAELDHNIASLMGIATDQIEINDLAVHPSTRQIFLSVHRGLGPDAVPVIFKVDDGRLEEVDLSTAEHSMINIGSVPDAETLEFGQPQNQFAITDIDFHGGEIFVSGISNETFASKLRRIAYPFDAEVSTTSIEIWHAVHAQFETRAPIITQDIQILDGVPTLIAVYACTPLVRIPIAELQDGAQIRGEMIGELGFGNTPIDIITYANASDGRDYVLVTNTNRSATRIVLDDIATVEPMPIHAPNNFGPAGIDQFSMPVTDALHLDVVDDGWVVTVRRNPHDVSQIDLHTLPLPFFFDRSDHIVEMNWPGAPDPFGYRSQQ